MSIQDNLSCCNQMATEQLLSIKGVLYGLTEEITDNGLSSSGEVAGLIWNKIEEIDKILKGEE